jgi:hypothetical protein
MSIYTLGKLCPRRCKLGWLTGVVCLLVLLAAPAAAQVRRAVIVGINNYAVDPRTDRTKNLDGAVNDAEAMVETLRTFHGFKAADIHLVTDQQATRSRILKELQEHLIDPAQPGDLSLFFFAGHGSYQENKKSREVDKRDETIVPADANRGVADIRDKELARLFNRVLDRKAGLVAIFDSCHSGSISRGIGDEGKLRFAVPRAAPAGGEGTADDQVAVSPEERGALFLAATQDQQPAQERFIKGQPRGRFTSALQQILNTSAPGEAVDSLFLRLRALMQAGGSVQEPALASTKERRQKTLWGTAASEHGARPRVAVGSVSGGTVQLQAGYAVGLGSGAALRSVGGAAVQLQVTEVLGPTTCKATVRAGSASAVKPGDLFEIESFGTPYLEPLRVFVGVAPPRRAELEAFIKALAPLRAPGGVTFTSDPTEASPTHTLLWLGGQWVLRDLQRHDQALGAQPTLAQLRKALGSGGPPVRLFVSLPLPAEQLAALPLGKPGSSKSVEVTPEPSRADYWLVGRVGASRPEFAWVLPGADKDSRPGVPLRSEWVGLGEGSFGAALGDAALRLARLKTWQTIDTPPGDRFPYRLQLQNLQTKQFVPPGTPVRNGETYRPVLLASGAVASVQPRYVYLFALDSNGGSSLLVPGPGMLAGENLVPDARDGAAAPKLIPIGQGFAVSPPFGTDTLVLLASATALPDPSVLVIKPLHRGVQAAEPCQDPLECLIFGINEGQTRGGQAAPADWSVERLIVHSVER